MTDQTRTRKKRRLLIAGGVLAIPAIALAWWLGSPLFLDTTVNETFPAAAPVTTEGIEPDVQSAEPDSALPSAVVATGDEETAVGPLELMAGEFVDADAAHRGSGSATIFELEDGSRVLRFEEFEVTNGPDLHVLLVPTGDPIDRDLLAEVGYEDLGKLKGNVGNQNYELSDSFDLDGSWTVVIYCDPFHVVFSTAQLSG
jgi:hypothetical protein